MTAKAALRICLPDADDEEDLKSLSNAIKIKYDFVWMLDAKWSICVTENDKSSGKNSLCNKQEAKDFKELMKTNRSEKVTWLSRTRNVTVSNKCPRRSLIMTLIPGCDLEHSQGTRVLHLSFCFTFLCDPDLGQRTLILIMTYHLIIVYPFMKSN